MGLLKDAGISDFEAKEEIESSIDRWVWYAGWADKFSHLLGTVNPVSGPYFNFTIPEPTGVVGMVVPNTPPFLGLISRLVPAIVSGNSVVLVAEGKSSMMAVTMGEVLATSDVPAGVVNILTGDKSDLLPWLLSHMDINSVDISGASTEIDPLILEQASVNVKRLVRRQPEEEGLDVISDFLEMKTIWHPVGK